MNRLAKGGVNTPVINGRAKEKHCLLVGFKPTSKQTIKTPSLREGSSRIKLFSRRVLSDEGVVLVEFAIVALFLFTLAAAVIDFGRAFNAHLMLNNFAREAVRLGSQWPELRETTLKDLHLVGASVDPAQYCKSDGDAPACEGHRAMQSRLARLRSYYSMSISELEIETSYDASSGGVKADSIRVLVEADFQGLIFGKLYPLRLRVEATGPYLY